MTTDPTMRTVWHKGHAFPVSNSPPGRDRGKYWYVLVDGDWQRLFACAKEDPSIESWGKVESHVLEWLRNHTPGE